MESERKRKRIRLSSLPNSAYILLILFVFLSITVPKFCTATNLSNLLLQSSTLIVISVGMSLVIMSGDVDLSMGGVISLAGVIAAMGLRAGLHWIPALLLALAASGVYGLFNGIVVHKLKVPAFIATFGSMGIAQSLANTLSSKRTVYWEESPLNAVISAMNQNLFTLRIGPRSVDVISVSSIPLVCLVLAAVVILLYGKTSLKAHVYAIGHNEEIARLSGIHVDRLKIGLFGISGLLAGVAGCLLMVRTGCVQPTMGEGMEFYAIVAAVLGGNLMQGGRGSIPGAIMGALVLYCIRNAMVLAGFTTFAVMVTIGFVLILGMLVNMTMEFISRRGERKTQKMSGNGGDTL